MLEPNCIRQVCNSTDKTKRLFLYLYSVNEKLRYLLPKSKFTETIKLSDIKAIEIKLFEIKIRLPECEKMINLGNIQFKELKRIKERFEDLKSIAEKNRPIKNKT